MNNKNEEKLQITVFFYPLNDKTETCMMTWVIVLLACHHKATHWLQPLVFLMFSPVPLALALACVHCTLNHDFKDRWEIITWFQLAQFVLRF